MHSLPPYALFMHYYYFCNTIPFIYADFDKKEQYNYKIINKLRHEIFDYDDLHEFITIMVIL